MYGDSINDKEMFKLHKGVIKIRISGNGKLYCHVPYTNYSSDTMKFNKGEKVGVLSIYGRCNAKVSKSKSKKSLFRKFIIQFIA